MLKCVCWDVRWGIYLCSALRGALEEQLTPEQLTAVLQGTAGLYQDLRAELRNRMQVFEEYALAEILKVPPGLLVDGIGDASTCDGDEVKEEEEEAVEEALRSLRQQVAGSKRRIRDMQAAIAELDRLIAETASRLATLETVPAVLAGQDTIMDDVKKLAEKGTAIEAGCVKLSSTHPISRADGKGPVAVNVAGEPEEPLTGMIACCNCISCYIIGVFERQSQERRVIVPFIFSFSDGAVEREILKHQPAMKNAPVEDLRKMREALGLV